MASECLHVTLENHRFLSDLGWTAGLLVLATYAAFSLAAAALAGIAFRPRTTQAVAVAAAYFVLVSLQLFWLRAKILSNAPQFIAFFVATVIAFSGIDFLVRRLRLHPGAPVLAVFVYYNLCRSLADDWSSRGGNLVAFVIARETIVKTLIGATVLAALVWISTRWQRLARSAHLLLIASLVTATVVASHAGQGVPDAHADVENTRKPDIFVLSFDAMRADALAAHVSSHPNGRLSQIWRHGRAFKNIVSDGLSTYAILSNNTRGGVRRHDCSSSIPSLLKKNGYHTSMFLGRYAERIDAAGCYERYYTGTGFPLATRFMPIAVGRALLSSSAESQLRANFIPTEDVLTEVANFLEARPKSPIFSYIHFLDLHAPYIPASRAGDPAYLAGLRGYMKNCYTVACDPENKHYQQLIAMSRAGYMDVFKDIDRQLDQFFGILHARGRPYILVLTSDHGELFGEHGGFGHSGGFAPELLKIPFIVYRSQSADKASSNCELMLGSEALNVVIRRVMGAGFDATFPHHDSVAVRGTVLGDAVVDLSEQRVRYKIRPGRRAHAGTARNIHRTNTGSLPFPIAKCVQASDVAQPGR